MKHVNARTVIGLALAAAIAIAAAVAITAARKPVAEEGNQSAQYAFPELRDRLNDVKSVTIAGAGNAALVTLEKRERGWVVKEKADYPAILGEIRGLLIKLGDARLSEKKTANEQRFGELAVEDTAKPDAKGLLLTVDGLGKPLKLIIGKSNGQVKGNFVRRPDEPQSWLTATQLTFAKDPVNWIDRTLTDISAERIMEVTLRRPDGKTLRVFKRAGDANFQVADVPKGRELLSEFAPNSIGSALTTLRLEDVRPSQGRAPTPDRKTYSARFTTFDGLIVSLTGWKEGDKNFAQIETTLDAQRADANIRAEQEKTRAEHEARQPKDAAPEAPPLAVSDPEKFRQQRLAALDAEAAELQRRFAGWTFQLPAFSFANIEKSLDELLKPAAGSPPGKRAAGKP